MGGREEGAHYNPGLPPWPDTHDARWWRADMLLGPNDRPPKPLHPLECLGRSLRALQPPIEFSLEELKCNYSAERKA
eukprot:11070767-Alexandrium_andersonii.AAC.1